MGKQSVKSSEDVIAKKISQPTTRLRRKFASQKAKKAVVTNQNKKVKKKETCPVYVMTAPPPRMPGIWPPPPPRHSVPQRSTNVAPTGKMVERLHLAVSPDAKGKVVEIKGLHLDLAGDSTSTPKLKLAESPNNSNVVKIRLHIPDDTNLNNTGHKSGNSSTEEISNRPCKSGRSTDLHNEETSEKITETPHINKVIVKIVERLRPSDCSCCGKVFVNRTHLQMHLKKLECRTYSCGHCENTSADYKTMVRHLRKHSSDTVAYMCKICGIRTKNQIEMEDHVRAAHSHSENSGREVMSPEETLMEEETTQEKITSSKVSHECSCCGEKFNTNDELMSHLASHLTIYTCDICGEAFEYRSDYKLHRNIHLDLTCEHCHTVYESSDKLIDHLGSNHQEETIFNCSHCRVAFSKHEHYVTHIKSHKDNKNGYKCEFCSKFFPYLSSYSNHLASHTKVKRFQCEVCGSAFSTNAALQSHSWSHTDKHACPVCDKRFKNSSSLQKHQLSHNTDGPHVCQYCNKAYSAPAALQSHIRTHTGESQFLCESCGKTFNNSANLSAHKKTHGGCPSRNKETSELIPQLVSTVNSKPAPPNHPQNNTTLNYHHSLLSYYYNY